MRVDRAINAGQPKSSKPSRLYIKGFALVIFSAVTVNFFQWMAINTQKSSLGYFSHSDS